MTDTASNNSMKLARVVSTFPTGATSQGNPIPLDCANSWARESSNDGTTNSVEIIENPTEDDYRHADSYLDSVSRGINLLLSHPESLIAEADGNGSSPTHDSLRNELTRISLMKNVICLHK
jgi:hypothetical protein